MMMMMIDDEKDDNDDNGEIYDDIGPLARPRSAPYQERVIIFEVGVVMTYLRAGDDDDDDVKDHCDWNKLASFEATLVQNYDPPTDQVTDIG